MSPLPDARNHCDRRTHRRQRRVPPQILAMRQGAAAEMTTMAAAEPYIQGAVSEDIADRISAMLLQESSSYRVVGPSLPRPSSLIDDSDSAPPCPPGCSSPSCPARLRPVDAACRTRMAAWSYQIADYCHYRRDVVPQAASFLDLYLSTPSAAERGARTDRRVYQLCSMTALYTAVKITECEVMDPASIAGLSRGRYAGEDVANTERIMLDAVGWRVAPPTAGAFVGQMLELLRATGTVPPPPPPHSSTASSSSSVAPALDLEEAHEDERLAALCDLSKYQAELSVLDPDLAAAGVPASSVALASILNALESVYGPEALPRASAALHVALGCQRFSPSLCAPLKRPQLADPSSSVVVEARRRLAEAFEDHSGYDMFVPLSLSSSTTTMLSSSEEEEQQLAAASMKGETNEDAHQARRDLATSAATSAARCSRFTTLWRTLSGSSEKSMSSSLSSASSSSTKDLTSPRCVSRRKLE